MSNISFPREYEIRPLEPIKPVRLPASEYLRIGICSGCKLPKDSHKAMSHAPWYGGEKIYCPWTEMHFLYGSAVQDQYEPMDNLEIIRYANGEEV